MLLVKHSFDPDTGSVLPVQEMESFMWDLKSESLPDADITESCSLTGTLAPSQLRSSTTRFPQVEYVETDTPSTLQVLRNEANFIPRPKRRRKRRSVHAAELKNLDSLDLEGASLLDVDNDVDDKIVELEPFLVTPALVHLKSTMPFPKVEDKLCALKVSGTDATIPAFIPKVTSYIRNLRSIYVLELQNMDGQDQEQNHSSTYQEFTMVLYQSSSLVSMELSDVDSKLIGLLMQNLPLSLRRLSVESTPGWRTRLGSYNFPPEVHLVCLCLHNCISSVGNLFRNISFPYLRKISMKNEDKRSLTWTKEDAQSLLDAIRTGKMSMLEELRIKDCCLTGCGPELVEILKAESLYSAEFIGAELNKEDGQILLKNIQDGNLEYVEYLNLLDNDELGPLTTDLKTACDRWEITLEMNPLIPLPETGMELVPVATVVSGFTQGQVGKDTGSDATIKDVASHVASLASSFTSEETQGIRTFISHLTLKQAQSLVTQLSSVIPEQVQTRLTIFSHSKVKQKKSSTRQAIEPQCTSGLIRTNVTKNVKNLACNVIFQIESSCRLQPANIANEALEAQLVLGALRIFLPKLLNSVIQVTQQEPREDSDGDIDLDLEMDPAPETDVGLVPVATVVSGFTQDQSGKDTASDVTKKDSFLC